MKINKLIVLSLLATLYGCQPEAPTQQSVAPVTEESPAVTPPAILPVVSAPPATAVQAEVAPVEKTVQDNVKTIAEPKKAAVQKPVVAPPKFVPPALPVEPVAKKVEVAPVAPPAAKSEVKHDAVLSDADGRKLAQQSGCFMCHSIERKIVGPAWKEVADKYRGDASAEEKLVTKVAKGGSGVWGSAAMPANSPRVSDTNIRVLVRFVLSLK